jgi:hypothetical protein
MRLKVISGDESPKVVAFFCPGCNEEHHVWVNGSKLPNGANWGFNNDFNAPTFTPSIVIRSGHFVPGFNKDKDSCWCTYNKEHPDEPVSFECGVCHSFVKNGKIQFLNDCTHKLAGQTVELPEIESVN